MANEQKMYKGFAYTKESEKYQMVMGDSEQEILERLAKWNVARTESMKYVYCNIGRYDENVGKHINYQKYDVETGKNISPLALKIPSMSRSEFEQTTREFKENGAKWNSTHKAWYVSADNPNMDYFEKYLVNKEATVNEIAAQPDAELKESVEAPELTSEPTSESVPGTTPEPTPEPEKPLYAPELESLAQTAMSLDLYEMDVQREKLALLQEMVDKDMDANGQISDLTNTLLDSFKAEIIRYPEGELVVSYKKPEQQQENVVKNDTQSHEEIVREQGDAVSFPGIEDIPKETVIPETVEKQYHEGDRMEVYCAKTVMLPNDPGNYYVGAIKQVKGTVEEISHVPEEGIVYRLRDDDSFTMHVYESEMYSQRQADVLLRATKDNLPPEQFHIVAQRSFASAQMEELRLAFKEGLTVEQVKEFANPEMESWQMDLCKYGMQHGLTSSEIKETFKEADTDWFQGRKAVNGLIGERRQERIKELSRNGFSANEKTVERMEQLDHLTHRKNSLKDICNAFKEDIYKNSPAGDIVKMLGKEFQRQEMQRQAMQELLPEM